jgi:hypothetical protein
MAWRGIELTWDGQRQYIQTYRELFWVVYVGNEGVGKKKRRRTHVAASGLENVISMEEPFPRNSTFLIGPMPVTV